MADLLQLAGWEWRFAGIGEARERRFPGGWGAGGAVAGMELLRQSAGRGAIFGTTSWCWLQFEASTRVMKTQLYMGTEAGQN